MKTTRLILPFLTAAAAVSLTACDEAKDAAAEAKKAAAEAAAKAEAAAPGLKAKASEALEKAEEAGASALEKAKAAGAGAFEKSKELLGDASDWTKQKLGIPEADGLLDGFKHLFEEARTAVSNGMTSEKAAALRAKWDAAYASATERMKTMAPEHQEKLKAALATVKAKWDELLEKSKNGTIE